MKNKINKTRNKISNKILLLGIVLFAVISLILLVSALKPQEEIYSNLTKEVLFKYG